MAGKVVYLFRSIIMLETMQGDLGCSRRVGGFRICSCVSYQLVHLEVSHTLLACNSVIVETGHYP